MGGYDAAFGRRSSVRRSTLRPRRAGATAVVSRVVAAALLVGTVVSCSSGDGDPGDAVDGAAAVTALVDWAVEELPVVENDDGEVELPVVYVTAQSGDTMDAGLQATVVAETTDTATVRFADDRGEAIDDRSDIDAVRDGGVMLVVGDLPEPGPTLSVDVEWYESLDASSVLVVQIDAAESGATVITAQPG